MATIIGEVKHSAFAKQLIAWQKKYGRHDLPWQKNATPYSIWVSEIMLQQTQVTTVQSFYERFLAKWPTLEAFAQASEDDLMQIWSGLGYYSRAKNMLRCAKQVMQEYQGQFPQTLQQLMCLPGIGQSTAAAIAVFAYEKQEAIADGNVIRVLSRVFAMKEDPTTTAGKQKFFKKAQLLLPKKDIRVYTQGIMDLGATVCLRSSPLCEKCPFKHDCLAYLNNAIEQFPNKQKKVVVTKLSVAFLIFVHGNKVYLEKRTKSGIWPSLYAFPLVLFNEKDSKKQRNQLVNEVLTPIQNIQQKVVLPVYKHQLTHRHLTIYPYIIYLDAKDTYFKKSAWYSVQSALNKGLPVPVRKILETNFIE